MNSTKSLFKSKTFWGAVIAIVASLAGLFGFEITATDQQDLIGLYDQALAAWDSIAVVAGGLLAIYGRVTATSRIG
ncbi:hypothetical protein [Roseibium sp. MB-4]